MLFLCTGNSCRSQIAEGFAKVVFGEAVQVYSAGTHPSDQVNPLAIGVMREKGIDISGHYPKSLAQVAAEVDVVITLCGEAEEECPAYPGAQYIEHWRLPDPARAVGTEEEVLQVFRNVRDEIERRIQKLAYKLRKQ